MARRDKDDFLHWWRSRGDVDGGGCHGWTIEHGGGGGQKNKTEESLHDHLAADIVQKDVDCQIRGYVQGHWTPRKVETTKLEDN